ncbi:MAG: nucleotidyltransferase [Nocardioides sp.]|nr:nucleotidyltransferase [Nocardioides sp.]
MAYDAVLRNLAVIGEAVRTLPSEVKDARPDVAWPAIAGLRNVVIHEYFKVNPAIIRDIVDNHLVPLREALTQSPEP